MLSGWAWQAIELASYIVTGWSDSGPADQAEGVPEKGEGDEQAGAEVAAAPGWIDLDKPLPTGLPPHVAAALQQLQGAFRPAGALPRAEDRMDRAKRFRDYVEQYRDKPDGLKELNSQGYFPVDGSEPPRSEPLHDVHCNRWSYDQQTGQWHRWVRGLAIPGGPTELASGSWGPALAEHGPFHVCV
jgi:hypothetical protein